MSHIHDESQREHGTDEAVERNNYWDSMEHHERREGICDVCKLRKVRWTWRIPKNRKDREYPSLIVYLCISCDKEIERFMAEHNDRKPYGLAELKKYMRKRGTLE